MLVIPVAVSRALVLWHTARILLSHIMVVTWLIAIFIVFVAFVVAIESKAIISVLISVWICVGLRKVFVLVVTIWVCV